MTRNLSAKDSLYAVKSTASELENAQRKVGQLAHPDLFSKFGRPLLFTAEQLSEWFPNEERELVPFYELDMPDQVYAIPINVAVRDSRSGDAL